MDASYICYPWHAAQETLYLASWIVFHPRCLFSCFRFNPFTLNLSHLTWTWCMRPHKLTLAMFAQDSLQLKLKVKAKPQSHQQWLECLRLKTLLCWYTLYKKGRVLHKHLPNYLPRPGASKSQIRASILKDQEITVARFGQAKRVILWPYDFQYNFLFSFGGKYKYHLGKCFFLYKFAIYLPKWASGDKNLCSTLQIGMCVHLCTGQEA